MSYGLVVCDGCNREIHQGGSGWFHCEDRTPICLHASGVFPAKSSQIVGPWCGADDLDCLMGAPVTPGSIPGACAHSPAIVHRTGGKDAKLDNVCGKCGGRIIRKIPAGAWKLSATQEPAEREGE